MKAAWIIVTGLVALLLGGAVGFWTGYDVGFERALLISGVNNGGSNQNANTPPPAAVASYDDCVAAGYPVQESYPPVCRTPDGRTFTQDIGNELEKQDLIRVANPRPNTTISSPLQVSGTARGTWFFEASFPVRLLDADGQLLGLGVAQAQGDWMTVDFVPFTATLTFTVPTNTTVGTLIFQKDNPSGLPQNDDQLRLPVRF